MEMTSVLIVYLLSQMSFKFTKNDLRKPTPRVVPVTESVLEGFRARQYVYRPPEWDYGPQVTGSFRSIPLPPLDFRPPPPEPPLIMWLPGVGRAWTRRK
jgi:hypothetical protein